MLPIGSPSGDQCRGMLTAGWPVMLNTAVNGVQLFIRSNALAGSPVSVNQPTGAGGWARVGVSSTSYGSRASRLNRVASCSRPRALVNSTALIALPRSRR